MWGAALFLPEQPFGIKNEVKIEGIWIFNYCYLHYVDDATTLPTSNPKI